MVRFAQNLVSGTIELQLQSLITEVDGLVRSADFLQNLSRDELHSLSRVALLCNDLTASLENIADADLTPTVETSEVTASDTRSNRPRTRHLRVSFVDLPAIEEENEAAQGTKAHSAMGSAQHRSSLGWMESGATSGRISPITASAGDKDNNSGQEQLNRKLMAVLAAMNRTDSKKWHNVTDTEQ